MTGPVPRAGTSSDQITEVHGDRVPADAYYDDDGPVEGPDPGDLARADWHLRMAQFWERVAASEAAAAEEVIAGIRDRTRARQEQLAARVARHDRVLETWHRAEVGEKRAAETLHLPSGALRVKKAPSPRLVIVDEDQLRAELAGMTTDTGEPVEELAYPVKEPQFSVRALESAIGCRPKGRARNGETGARYEIRDPDTGKPIEGAYYLEVPTNWSRS